MSTHRKRSSRRGNRALGIFLALVLVGVLVVTLFRLRGQVPAESTLTEKQTPLPTLSASRGSTLTSLASDAPPLESPAEPRSSLGVNGEVVATLRMLAAHNSLRAPDVRDPDSAANRAILQAMILKSIQSRSESEPSKNQP